MVLATHAGSGVTAALRPELAAMVDDLRDRLAADPSTEAAWHAQHKAALTARRSATSWTDWSTDLLTQAAVGWVLGTVFVRFCEDNRLLGGHTGSRTHGVWITSNDRDRRQQAMDAERVFYQTHSDLSYREWLETAFDAFRREPATKELVGDHSAIHILTPSSDAVNRLLTFWRRTDDNGDLLWDFTDPELTTRFLGDLYQDLSDYAKNKYALLQTPDFVEEFILDQTMEPALKDRPLQGFKMIDPTCGSGHFLLGAFERLLSRWDKAEPGLEPWARVQKALDGVYGVDLNPFAVAIARFRLIVAALRSTNDKTLLDAPGFVVHVAVGDSLLHGESQLIMTSPGSPELDVDLEVADFTYATEDLKLLRRILVPGSYDVVVGNPPYIEVNDRVLKGRYRDAYPRLSGGHMFPVLFMQRFFDLARRSRPSGWVGQITSNAFMTREFGTDLVEKYIKTLDVRVLIDCSGAFIPGHGTPTLILVGRNERRTTPVRVVYGIENEATPPAIPADGIVWREIVDHIDAPGYESKFISVADASRESLDSHPWSLRGGDNSHLMKQLDLSTGNRLSTYTFRVGFQADSHSDEIFTLPSHFAVSLDPERMVVRESVRGEGVRDYQFSTLEFALLPYDTDGALLDLSLLPVKVQRFLWRFRNILSNRAAGSGTYREVGRAWYSWHQLPKDAGASPLTIAFGEVATHNHFVLDRERRLFNRTAPIIKLHDSALPDDHVRLLGMLNSSIACFWLRQRCHNKGRPGAEQTGAGSTGINSTDPMWRIFQYQRERSLNIQSDSMS